MGLADQKWVFFRRNSVGQEYYLILDPTGFEGTNFVSEATGFPTARAAYDFAAKYDYLGVWKVGLRS